MERIFATYRIETPLVFEKVAAVLAGERSSGTFVAVQMNIFSEFYFSRFFRRHPGMTPMGFQPHLKG